MKIKRVVSHWNYPLQQLWPSEYHTARFFENFYIINSIKTNQPCISYFFLLMLPFKKESTIIRYLELFCEFIFTFVRYTRCSWSPTLETPRPGGGAVRTDGWRFDGSVFSCSWRPLALGSILGTFLGQWSPGKLGAWDSAVQTQTQRTEGLEKLSNIPSNSSRNIIMAMF